LRAGNGRHRTVGRGDGTDALNREAIRSQPRQVGRCAGCNTGIWESITPQHCGVGGPPAFELHMPIGEDAVVCAAGAPGDFQISKTLDRRHGGSPWFARFHWRGAYVDETSHCRNGNVLIDPCANGRGVSVKFDHSSYGAVVLYAL